MPLTDREYANNLRALVLLSLLVLLAACQIPPVLAQDGGGEVVVGVPANFPPHYFVDEKTGEPYGFARL
jgi:ABC-type amino acid transport substrate-binding protein